MYAFYDSMKLDTNLQFDFLPINVKKAYNKQSYKDKMASHMQAYFNDQKLRQANKTQSEVRSISNDLSSISIEKSKRALGAKRNELGNRTEYFKTYKRICRQNSVFKAKERESKQSARRNPVLGPKKLCIRVNQSNLQEKTLSLKQKKENQSNLHEKTLTLKQKKEHQSNLQEGILF